MKRVLSWIVLALCLFVSCKIIQFIVYIGFGIATRVYDASRGIFWLIIIVGGSFGLGIAYAFSFAAVSLCTKFSEKVFPSAKGTRYIVGATITGLLFLLDFLLCFTTNMSGITFAHQIVIDIFAIFFSVLLFFSGKNHLYED